MENIFIIKAEDWSPIESSDKKENAIYLEALEQIVKADSIDQTRIEDFGIYKKDDIYRTTGFVGINWLKDTNGNIIKVKDKEAEVAICVNPRFNNVDPWEMLTTVLFDEEYEKYIAYDSNKFFELFFDRPIWAPIGNKGGELLLIISYLRSLQALCRKKISHKMECFEQNFNGSVHGNINLQKHIDKNISQGREDRVYCKYFSFTVDTIENRILKKACLIVRDILRSNKIEIPELYNMLAFCLSNLEKVSNVSISRSDFSNLKITGFNSKYKEPIALAKNLIEHIALNTDKQSKNMHYIIPYAIKMESLFEFYIRAKFKYYFKNIYFNYRIDDYRRPGDSLGLKVYNSKEKLYLMEEYIPDILIQVKSETDKEIYKNVAVLDVKYQHSKDVLIEKTARRHNSHQLLAYTLLLNVDKCGFVFPFDGDDSANKSVNIEFQNGNINTSARKFYQWIIKNDEINNLNHFFEKILHDLNL